MPLSSRGRPSRAGYARLVERSQHSYHLYGVQRRSGCRSAAAARGWRAFQKFGKAARPHRSARPATVTVLSSESVRFEAESARTSRTLNSRSARVCAVRPGQVYYSASKSETMRVTRQLGSPTSEEAAFSGAPENTASRLSGPNRSALRRVH
jgi:hypothetical protein